MALNGKPLVFGCEQLGGYEWGDLDIAEIEAAIAVAMDHGVCLFDTADCYGQGLSEERLGSALRHAGPDVRIATKGGVRFGPQGVFYDNSADWLSQALDASLKRLGRDHVDLYQMHHWDGVTPAETICETLEGFCATGRIRAYGLCNIPHLPKNPEDFPNLCSLSLEFSLASRASEPAARTATAAGLHFLPYGCLGQGILSGKYVSPADFPENDRRTRDAYGNFHGQRLARNLKIVAVLRRWADHLEQPVPTLAMAWVHQHLDRTWPLIGVKRPDHILQALASLDVTLPPQAMADLDAVSRDDGKDTAP